MAAALSELEVEAGATVITLDDYGTAIYFVEHGEADVVPDGGEEDRGVGPGDVVGEIGLLLTGQRTASVVARTPMRLLSLSGQDFDRIRARVPEVERSLRRLGLERHRLTLEAIGNSAGRLTAPSPLRPRFSSSALHPLRVRKDSTCRCGGVEPHA